MAEYIDREATIDALDCRDEYDDLVNTIREQPAADVQPVKRGRWIKQEGFWNKNTVKCSLCGNYLDMNGVNGGRGDANFCPNCGAKMIKDNDVTGKVNERNNEVGKPDGNCLACKFQYLEDSDYWCSICIGNPQDI